METALSSLLSGLITQALQQGLQHIANNPQSIEQFFVGLQSFGCHNAADVAQDALEAYEHGHLSREQALQIVQICLEKKHGPTVDVASKRVQLEQLFR